MADSKQIDLQDIIADLEEALGFAAMSPQGRENIASAISSLEEAAEVTYRKGFVDGEQNRAEYDTLVFDRMLEESIRRMNQPKILGFDGDGDFISNPEYLPNSDTQIGVEFAIEYLTDLSARKARPCPSSSSA